MYSSERTISEVNNNNNNNNNIIIIENDYKHCDDNKLNIIVNCLSHTRILNKRQEPCKL